MPSYRKKPAPPKKKWSRYLISFLLLAIPILLPFNLIDKTRKATLSLFFSFLPSKKPVERTYQQEITENYLLREEIQRLHSIIYQLQETILWEKDSSIKNAFKKQVKDSLFFPTITVPAQIIYRDPSSWGSSCWINVGKQTNHKTGLPVITKNSPVVIGNVLVGLIDFVGEKQSRVRFVTDADIKPAVKVDNGIIKNFDLFKHVDHLLLYLQENEEPIPKTLSSPCSSNFIDYLIILKNRLQTDIQHSNILLQGTVCGTGNPIKKRGSTILKGNAFCFSSSFEGAPLLLDEKYLPLIKPLDLLVTTGTDGIFPPGLIVGKVTKVIFPKAGSCTYDLEAISEIPDFNKLSQVFVIPHIVFDKNDTPNILRFFQNNR